MSVYGFQVNPKPTYVNVGKRNSTFTVLFYKESTCRNDHIPTK